MAPEPGGRPRFRFGAPACPAAPVSTGPVASPAPCSSTSAAAGASAGASTFLALLPAGCCCVLLRFGVTELSLEVLPLGRPRLRGTAAAASAAAAYVDAIACHHCQRVPIASMHDREVGCSVGCHVAAEQRAQPNRAKLCKCVCTPPAALLQELSWPPRACASSLSQAAGRAFSWAAPLPTQLPLLYRQPLQLPCRLSGHSSSCSDVCLPSAQS